MKRRFLVTIHVHEKTIAFVNRLQQTHMKIHQMRRIDDKIQFETDKKGISTIRKFRRSYRVKVTVKNIDSTTSYLQPVLLYFIWLVVLIPFVCSFFLWRIDIVSSMPEVNEEIRQYLQKSSIKKFRLLASLPSEDEMRQQMMVNDHRLAWVRFEKKGTSLVIYPMLAPALTKESKETQPSDLIAKHSGVITHFDLSKGERAVPLHSTVAKGSLLATGTLEQGEEKVVIGAEGAVYANYVIQYSFSIPNPLKITIQEDEEVFISWHKPTSFELNPIKFVKQVMHVENRKIVQEKTYYIDETMQETVIIPLLKERILSEIGPNAQIKEEKVLHVTFDDDKVNGTILFLINDDIAQKRPIFQGD